MKSQKNRETLKNSQPKPFESGLRSSLRALAGEAPAGPTPSSVVAALQTRTRRRRAATLTAAALILLGMGVAWMLPSPTATTPGVSPELVVGAERVAPATGQAHVSSAFNTSALLGHMDSIPFDRNLILRVAGIDEVAFAPAPLAGSTPAWSSKLDLEKIDFAYLPSQGDCYFCVTVPSLNGHRPF